MAMGDEDEDNHAESSRAKRSPEKATNARTKRSSGVLKILWNFLWGSDNTEDEIKVQEYLTNARMAALAGELNTRKTRERAIQDGSNRLVASMEEMADRVKAFDATTVSLILSTEMNSFTAQISAIENQFTLIDEPQHLFATLKTAVKAYRSVTPDGMRVPDDNLQDLMKITRTS